MGLVNDEVMDAELSQSGQHGGHRGDLRIGQDQPGGTRPDSTERAILIDGAHAAFQHDGGYARVFKPPELVRHQAEQWIHDQRWPGTERRRQLKTQALAGPCG